MDYHWIINPIATQHAQDARGNVKLIDFGSAKDLANPQVKGAGIHNFKSVMQDTVGTPYFMAPEAHQQKTDADGI